ncbi:hypothetical protein [Azospirillum baldaniorum]|nr:hypothetical protein [Azospirillum baldaniorum]
MAAPMTWATYDGSKDGQRTQLWTNDAAWDGESFARSTSMGDGVFLFVHFRYASGTSPGTAGIYAFAIRVNEDKTISVGSPTVITTSGYLTWAASLSVLKVEAGKAVVFHNGAASPYPIYATTVTVASDLTVAVTNGPTNISSVLSGTRMDHSHAIMLDASRILLVGRSDSTSYRVRAYALTWNSAAGKVDTIPSTTYTAAHLTMENGSRLFKMSGTQAILVGTKTGTPFGLAAAVLTYNGTSLSTTSVSTFGQTNGTWGDNFVSNDTTITPGAGVYGVGESTTGMRAFPIKNNGGSPLIGTSTMLTGSSTDYRFNPLWMTSTQVIAICSDAKVAGDKVYVHVLDYNPATNTLAQVNGPVQIEPSIGSFGLESHRIDANRVLAVYTSDDGVTSAKVLSIV